MDNIVIERGNVTKFLGVLIETAHKRYQDKNIKKYCYTLQI